MSISNKIRGYAVVIVNEKEVDKSGFKERKGASNDSDFIQASFCNKLGFKWLNQSQSRDLKKSQWIHFGNPPTECDCLTCKIQKTDHSKSECFLLVISTHGREEEGQQIIRFSDGQKITLADVIDTLSDEKCPSLVGIPRIVVLQVCRTNNKLPEERRDDPGVEVIAGIGKLDINYPVQEKGQGDNQDMNDNFSGNDLCSGNDQSSGNDLSSGNDDSSEDESDADPVDDIFYSACAIPDNFLIMYPTTAGKRAKRNTRKGSWLIDELNDVICKHDFKTEPTMNFLKILTKTAGQVAKRTTKKDKFMNSPCLVHKLTCPLLFTAPDSNEMAGPSTSDIPAL